jgi:hypothetical protein
MKQIIILGFAITVAIVCVAGYEIIASAMGSSTDYSIQLVPDLNGSDPDLYDSGAPTHVPDEIVVKFKKSIADIIEDGLLAGEQPCDLKLSDSLNQLHKNYQLRDAKVLFKNFKKKRQQTKALLQKDRAFLTKKERHILKRPDKKRKTYS